MHIKAIIQAILLFTALAMRLAAPETTGIAYALLAVHALMGPAAAVYSIAFTWFFTMGNVGVFPESDYSSIARYFVLCTAFVSASIHYVFFGGKRQNDTLLVVISVFSILICIHSFLLSRISTVSILKIGSWYAGFASLFMAWGSLTSREFLTLEKNLFRGLVVVAMCSLVIINSDVGYLTNGFGFQGLLNQPQAFGLFVAVVCAWLISTVMMGRYFFFVTLGLTYVCLFLLYASRCRTAGFAVVLAIVLAVVVKLIFRNDLHGRIPLDFFLKRTGLMMLACVVPCLFVGLFFSNSIADFISKGHSESGFASVYEKSRGDLITNMIVNIRENPYTGIGFGIASDAAAMNVEYDPVLGLPVSASVEKGVMPLAILEETGAIGFAVFLILIGVLVVRAVNNGLPQLLVLFTVLLTNMAEYTFFSVGGMGMLMMIATTWSVSRPRMLLPPMGRPVRFSRETVKLL
jgi:hypothetical protein